MRRIAVFLAASVLTLSPCVAQDAAEEKNGADPTDFITRYEPTFEHKTLDDGSDLDLMILRTDLSFRPNLSLRLDFPLAGFRPDPSLEPAGFESTFGFGDVVTQILYKPYSGKGKAAIVGLRVDWDTATAGELGQGGTTYAPLAAVAFTPNPRLVHVPLVQWFLGRDFDNDPLPGERDRNALSFRQLVIWGVGKPNLAYLLVDPEVIVDFENDNDVTATLGLEFGKPFGRGTLLVLKPTIGLTDDTTDWGIKFAFRHMFPNKFLLK